MNAFQDLFIAVLNMSITASYVAIAVILVRLILKKVPKIFSYALWAGVLFRLICPLSFASAFSFLGLLRMDQQNSMGLLKYVPSDIGLMQQPSIQSGMDSINGAVKATLPQAPMASVNPMQIWIGVLSLIWLAGILVLLSYSIVSYLKIKRQLQTATRVKENIYESDRIGTAFVCGFFHPKIYVPVGVGGADFAYILEHERTHIRRKDYLIKPLAFLALTVHWFNPLMWLSFSLMSRDMEMSCDENVLRRMGGTVKGDYSSSLLSLSMRRKGLFTANPLAFGESDVKTRIKNVLNYKEPAFWVVVMAIITTASLLVIFTTNPKQVQTMANIYRGYDIHTLMENKTPYVGDNVKGIALIDAMPLPIGIERDTVELQTGTPPYQIIIKYTMNDASGIMVDGAIRGDAFYRNAMILFSLIDNVDVITCEIADETGMYNGASYGFSYTREAVQKLIGTDVRLLAESEEDLKSLIDRINNTPLGKHSDPQVIQVGQNADNVFGAVNFSDGMVEIAGEKLAYDKVDLAPLYETLTPFQVEQIMYRAVAFYKNVHQKDFTTLNRFSSPQLIAEMDKWGRNEKTKPEIDVMMHLDNYTDVDFPTGVTAPKQYDNKYVVILTIDKTMSAAVTFEIEGDGTPLVSDFALE